MPAVGFEPTILVLERAKTVCALDCAATPIGSGEVQETTLLLASLEQPNLNRWTTHVT
jgi:hypothetical protein